MSQDQTRILQEQLLAAAADGTRIAIRGSGSKRDLGRPAAGAPLDVTGHRGIVSYEPKELVVTARGGTTLEELEAELTRRGQMLAFEPPRFGPGATLGGTIAAGLSGPRRAYAGSARDFVLGTRVLTGRGEVLRFGGEVMKNVAGYDISRLMTGAWGTLGVLLEVSLKVLPRPAGELTLVQSRGTADALEAMNRWAGRPLPVSATCHDGERLYIRLSGAASAVDQARAVIGGDPLEDGAGFWSGRIREQGHAFFAGGTPLWRLALPSAAPMPALSGKWLIEWSGGQRWLRSDAEAEMIRSAAARLGGHATLFRHGDREGPVFHPLPAPLLELHRRLKNAFDPQGLLNPGRMYADF